MQKVVVYYTGPKGYKNALKVKSYILSHIVCDVAIHSDMGGVVGTIKICHYIYASNPVSITFKAFKEIFEDYLKKRTFVYNVHTKTLK